MADKNNLPQQLRDIAKCDLVVDQPDTAMVPDVQGGGGVTLLGAVIVVQVVRLRSEKRLHAATEHALHQALSRFLQGRTTLIIAHRLSAVKQADRVLVFDGGRIAEQGEHHQLIADGGLYATLYGHLQH